MWNTKLFIVATLLAGCADGAGQKGDDPFGVMSPEGKADGSGLLSPADRQRVEAAFDAVVQRGETAIGALEQEIALLEADHARKQQEADELVARIAARERELENDYNRNLLLCAFFPNPATCVLANYLANDSTLASYRQQLEQARAAQQAIATQIAEYRAKRDVLRGRIATIRDGKQRLLAMLRDDRAPTIPPALASSAETGRAYWRADAMAQVRAAIASEIATLVELRNAAQELSQVLDQSLATLRALEQSVDELVERSREQFMDLLAGLLSGDPGAAAERWLEDELARRTRMMLDSLAWPLNEFARFVVENDGGGTDELIDRIMRKLLDSAAAQPLVFAANNSAVIRDNATVRSSLDVAASRALSSVEVFVDIDHTYIGDLVISVEHDGRAFVLANQVGGSQNGLRRTYSIANLAGLPLAGRWTLVVSDTAAQDTGRLNRWQLIVR